MQLQEEDEEDAAVSVPEEDIVDEDGEMEMDGTTTQLVSLAYQPPALSLSPEKSDGDGPGDATGAAAEEEDGESPVASPPTEPINMLTGTQPIAPQATASAKSGQSSGVEASLGHKELSVYLELSRCTALLEAWSKGERERLTPRDASNAPVPAAVAAC